MKYLNQLTFILMLALMPALAACGKARAEADNAQAPAEIPTDTMTQTDTTSVKVKVDTSLGSFTVLLYGDTPIHRDNFVKLVKEGFYNGTLFHRVIGDFMVQAGDPDSRTAAPGQRLGSGDPGYTLEAEIAVPKHFHKRYALAAARQGDQVNPERRSSGSQFYVVTGRKVPSAAIEQVKAQMLNQQKQAIFNTLAGSHMEQIRSMQAAGDQAGLEALRQSLIQETETRAAEFHFTPEMEHAYTTVGGAPHLDGQYTVFGEVIEGMDVIDKIEKVETDAADRPVEDVRIISMEIVK